MVRMGLDLSFRHGHAPNLPLQPLPALVDTGATVCCIDSRIALLLGLPIVNREPMAGAHGQSETNVYLGHMNVPALNLTIADRFYGVDLVAGGQPHVALLGRTFLRFYTMTYEGQSGSVTISDDPPPSLEPPRELAGN